MMRIHALPTLVVLALAGPTLARAQDPPVPPDSTAVEDAPVPPDSTDVPVAPSVVDSIPPEGEASAGIEYRVLATNRTSTMEKELNEAAEAGFRFEGVMGGETAFGGSEVVSIVSRPLSSDGIPRYEYKLLATNRTSTMQKEMQEAGDAGFEYRGQTVFETMFGGQEVVVILERDLEAAGSAYEYKLLATQRTSTLQRELLTVGEEGFAFVGVTVAPTMVGGDEVIVITRRHVQEE